MKEKSYVLDGYEFENQEEYDRAKKEKETIVYLTANTDMTDMKSLLRIYNRSVDKNSFQTIIGQQFLSGLHQMLLGSGTVSEDTLAPIRIASKGASVSLHSEKNSAARAEKYKKAYENEVANQKIKNILIGVLLVVIAAMIGITAASRYSVFTYFTDYKNDMRNEIINEMENWQKQLEEREKELNQREGIQDNQN